MELKERLIDCVAGYARERPQEPAIIALGASTAGGAGSANGAGGAGSANGASTAGGAESANVWSWERLWHESGRIATLLLALGVRPGESVAYQVPNRAEFVAITLGVLRVGAVCAPLMPIFRERELAFALTRSQARVVFALDSYRGRRPSAEVASLSPRPEHLEHVIVVERLAERLEGLTANAGALEARRPPPNALAQLLFTSGTSGTPKGVLHRQDTLMRAVRLEIEHLGLSSRDRIYVPSPLAHQTGFLYGMWLALALGVAQILQEHWEPRRALRDMQRWGASFVQAATPFLLDLVQAVESGAEPPGTLRIFVPTGAAVPRTLARRAVETLQSAVCGAFGTTEGCLATLASPEDPPEQAWGSDGRALPSIRIRVCDEAGRELPAGTEGHFEIASPTMFDGYLDDPGATTQAYTADGWYRTGDLATIDAAGYLRITGRVKDVINRGGEKIPVADIEQLLYQHEAVREAAIVAMPDARLGERACVFVAPRPGRVLDLQALRIFLDERRVAKQYWPERLELLEELPKTASGKIQKYVLRERARRLASACERADGRSDTQ